MMYLSKGLAVQDAGDGLFYVSHCGQRFALGPELCSLWQAARLAPQPVPTGKEKAIRRLEESGIITVTDETGKLGSYRLLSDCVICPECEGIRGMLRPGRDARIWTWIDRAGLRLTACELIRLEEAGIKPVPALLGEDGRQELIQHIYTTDTIFDGILETAMEHSPARDGLVASLLRLLHAGRLYLV